MKASILSSILHSNITIFVMLTYQKKKKKNSLFISKYKKFVLEKISKNEKSKA